MVKKSIEDIWAELNKKPVPRAPAAAAVASPPLSAVRAGSPAAAAAAAAAAPPPPKAAAATAKGLPMVVSEEMEEAGEHEGREGRVLRCRWVSSSRGGGTRAPCA